MARRHKYMDPQTIGRLGRINLVARGVVEGVVTGLHKSPYHGFIVEFSEHRPYVPGDDPRHLDWRTSARTDRLSVKLYEDETNVRAYLLLDASASMAFGSREALHMDDETRDESGGVPLTKIEYACFLAACLAHLMIRQQDSVGLVTFDERVRTFLPPSTTSGHLSRILESLASIQPTERTDIASSFHDLAAKMKRRSLVVILSDLLDEGPRIKRALHHFRHCKHEVILFHLMDPAELSFPFSKLTDFIDLETGERLQVDPRYAREQYLRELNAFCDSIRRECAGSLVEYQRVETSQPLAKMLTSFLALRTRGP